MGDLFTDGLVIPALALALLGWIVPRLLSLVFPEGIRPLLVLAFVATLVMFVFGMLFFVALYIVDGVPLSRLFSDGLAPGLLHFGRLGLVSGLIWGPILVLSVAGLPRHWVEETW